MTRRFIRVYSDALNTFQKAQLDGAIKNVNGAQHVFFVEREVREVQLPGGRALNPDECKSFIGATLLDSERYVICVSGRRFQDYHFAHEDYGYLYMTVEGWEKDFAPPSLRCYITHIMAGALLSCAADLNEELANSHMHRKTRGCLMDFCDDKQEIKLGMYAGYLCGECQTTFRGLGVDDESLDAVDKVLRFVRAEAVGRPIITNHMTAFVIMQYGGENDAAFEQGIKTGLADVGIRAHRADHEAPGGQIFDNVRAGIRRAQFLIAKVDVPSLNVYLEVGLAMGSEKELLLVAEQNSNWTAPTDLANWYFLTYPQGDYAELRRKIADYYQRKFYLTRGG